MSKAKKEKAMVIIPNTLWEMSAELKAITDKIIENGGEVTEAIMEEMAVWQIAIEEKAERVAWYAQRESGTIEYYKAVENAARARRKAVEGSIESLKKYIKNCMVASGTTQIKKTDGLFTISLCNGRQSARIENAELLPMDLVETTVVSKPRTKEILQILKDGVEVSGATLETGEKYITIRSGGKKTDG